MPIYASKDGPRKIHLFEDCKAIPFIWKHGAPYVDPASYLERTKKVKTEVRKPLQTFASDQLDGMLEIGFKSCMTCVERDERENQLKFMQDDNPQLVKDLVEYAHTHPDIEIRFYAHVGKKTAREVWSTRSVF